MKPNPPSASGARHATLDEFQLPEETATRRLRERYIATRFVQFPEPAHTLNNTPGVMRWARQLLDDDHPRLAAELVQLALEENRSQRALWLCLIELSFLGNDPATFGE